MTSSVVTSSIEPAATTTQDVADWWTTSIIRMEPGIIEFRGRPVQDLIGNVSFVEMIWTMLRPDRPTAAQARLLEAAMVASVDHGPQAPSIAIARMAVTCGVAINNAMASGVNVLGDVHGGAGQQCMQMLAEVIAHPDITRRRPRPELTSLFYKPQFLGAARSRALAMRCTGNEQSMQIGPPGIIRCQSRRRSLELVDQCP